MKPLLEFKVWHKPTGQLYPVDYFRAGEVFRLCSEDETEYEKDMAFERPFNLDDCIILPYTGCLDRLGHKIWGGDVMRLDMIQGPKEKADGDEEYSCYQYVAFRNGGYILVNVGVDLATAEEWQIENFTDHPNCSIYRTRVGCMYQFPELMELNGTYPLHPDHIRNENEQPAESNA